MKRRRSRKRKSIWMIKLSMSLLAVMLIFVFASGMISERMMPLANAIATIEAKNRINQIIYDTINWTVVEGDIVTADFYSKTEDADGNVTSLTVNTVLVNALCAEVGDNISSEFASAGSDAISIPIGALMGADIFANFGPNYTVRMLPRGNAEVDYKTKFEAVGINQINFQVWLDVAVLIRIVNPLQSDEVLVERKVSLVNTVFSGKVPENYIGGIPVNVGN